MPIALTDRTPFRVGSTSGALPLNGCSINRQLIQASTSEIPAKSSSTHSATSPAPRMRAKANSGWCHR